MLWPPGMVSTTMVTRCEWSFLAAMVQEDEVGCEVVVVAAAAAAAVAWAMVRDEGGEVALPLGDRTTDAWSQVKIFP